MIIATYRPAEMLASKHPFHQVKLHLEGRGISHDIRLRFLSEEDVERYVANRFSPHDFPMELIRFIHRRTEGNPLFMADILRYLRDRGIVAASKNGWSMAQPVAQIAREVPDSIRSMIQVQIDRFTDGDRKLMVAAAIEGVEFDSAVVAKTLALDPIEVEETLPQIEQVHGFIRLVGEQEYPDRTLTVRYRFVHVFYQLAVWIADAVAAGGDVVKRGSRHAGVRSRSHPIECHDAGFSVRDGARFHAGGDFLQCRCARRCARLRLSGSIAAERARIIGGGLVAGGY
jgi:predicted ATPase